ncbi:twin-arginine translocation signal domain-containing protein [uncultured Cohaesibacter sp.]|uniref:twin-arginine translocation signal domain-containing protein n=1 Tax=uncultured Cohaesibacter sp. TaxID=1002546 RepID=UPI0029C78882|nr:twin-arginine translocation signal domain-containing protein [uncultured Cohaesibacter sp.]
MFDRRTLLKGTALAAASGVFGLPAATPAKAAAPEIKLRDLYNKDMSFSDFANAHADKIILVNGFMAPPLKAESKFFVLTKMPMAVCPFCEPETDWPDDILAVYARRIVDVIPFNRKIVVEGRLRLGGYSDPETGFYSMVRLEDAKYERV